MVIKRYNATIRNLEYRLRAFKDSLPDFLEGIIRDKEDVIVSAITNDQLYRRGINGKGIKIMSYRPYTARTVEEKILKGQPTSRVTLRDTGAFYESMHVVFDSEGFYIEAIDDKTPYLIEKYGGEILRLTDKNFTRIIRSHIRKELVKKLKQVIKR